MTLLIIYCAFTYGFEFVKVINVLNDKEQMQMLKEAHLKKIDLSDAILVVNVNDYIGDSTRSEVEYATQKGKQVLYYTDLISHNG